MYKNRMELAQAHEQEGYVDRVFEIDGWEKGIQSVTRSANKKTAISQFILEYPQFAGTIRIHEYISWKLRSDMDFCANRGILYGNYKKILVRFLRLDDLKKLQKELSTKKEEYNSLVVSYDAIDEFISTIEDM